MDVDPPFLAPGTGKAVRRASPMTETLYAVCTGPTPTLQQLPLYLREGRPGRYEYEVGASCSFRWAFSSAVPGLRARGARGNAAVVVYADDLQDGPESGTRTRRFGDSTLTEIGVGDFSDLTDRCTVTRPGAAPMSVSNCQARFAGDLNGDGHTDFVFRTRETPGCDSTATLVSTPTGWTAVRSRP